MHVVFALCVYIKWKTAAKWQLRNTSLYFTSAKVLQKRLSLTKSGMKWVSMMLKSLNLILLQVCSSPCSQLLFSEIQFEVSLFQRRSQWGVLNSLIILNPVKLPQEYWFKPIARKWLRKKASALQNTPSRIKAPHMQYSLTFSFFLFLVFFCCSFICSEKYSCTT